MLKPFFAWLEVASAHDPLGFAFKFALLMIAITTPMAYIAGRIHGWNQRYNEEQRRGGGAL